MWNLQHRPRLLQSNHCSLLHTHLLEHGVSLADELANVGDDSLLDLHQLVLLELCVVQTLSVLELRLHHLMETHRGMRQMLNNSFLNPGTLFGGTLTLFWASSLDLRLLSRVLKPAASSIDLAEIAFAFSSSSHRWKYWWRAFFKAANESFWTETNKEWRNHIFS